MRIPDGALVLSGENNGKECHRHPCRFVEVLLRSTALIFIKYVKKTASAASIPVANFSFEQPGILVSPVTANISA